MKIAVVEDDKNDIRWLKRIFREYKKNESYTISIIYYHSGKQLLDDLAYMKYELILMDIYMDGMDGIETANCIQEIDEQAIIVFLTTSEDEIWRAVKTHNCFDYIQKQTFDIQRLIQLLQDVYKKLKIQDELLVFLNGKQEIKIKLKEIQYIMASDKYTVFTLNGQIKRYRITFSKIYELLEHRDAFVLCNRGILLHMEYISSTDGDIFLMKDKTKYPIRRRERKKIIDKFHDYQFKKLEKKRLFS